MSYEVARKEGHLAQILDRVRRIFVSEDYAMDVQDKVVYVDASGGAITITLPSVAEAGGLIFVVRAVDTDSGNNTVTVEDKGDDAGLADVALATDGAAAVMFSDGAKWYKLN